MILKTEKDNFPIEELEIRIDQISPNNWNPNEQSVQIFEKLKKILQEIGFVQPVLVRKKLIKFLNDEEKTFTGYEIIDGYHRWKACKELKWEFIKIWCLVDDIDDQTAKMLTLVMNNTRGEDEVMKRAKLLTEIDSGQLQLLPFDSKEIEFEKNLLQFDFSKFDREIKIDEKEKNPLLKVIYLLHQARILLDDIHDSSNNSELRILIEDFRMIEASFRKITL